MTSLGRYGQSESRKKEIYEGVQSKACSGIYCSPVQEKDITVTCGSKADRFEKTVTKVLQKVVDGSRNQHGIKLLMNDPKNASPIYRHTRTY